MSLIAGILIILISIAHNVYGEKKQIPELKTLTNDSIVIGSMRIMIYQGGFILLAVGIIQLLWSLGLVNLSGIAVYFPLGIVLINVITTVLIAILLHPQIFKIIIPQLIIFGVIIALQFLSI